MLHLKSRNSGDLLAVADVQTPTHLNEHEKKLFEELRQLRNA
jgi:DnaJ-class molecular chaperone